MTQLPLLEKPEPLAKIMASAGGYSLRVDFKTQNEAIEYARRHDIKMKVTSYGY